MFAELGWKKSFEDDFALYPTRKRPQESQWFVCLLFSFALVSLVDLSLFLTRPTEYIGVGDRASALQTLHSILGTKRHHAKDKAGQKVLERVMLKYLDLCVEMRRGQMAKDGIHQYKYILKLSK